jgi:hypothetical protein
MPKKNFKGTRPTCTCWEEKKRENMYVHTCMPKTSLRKKQDRKIYVLEKNRVVNKIRIRAPYELLQRNMNLNTVFVSLLGHGSKIYAGLFRKWYVKLITMYKINLSCIWVYAECYYLWNLTKNNWK